jgi:glyoxylase-like metal-dependent hydrolase (beta-lactamase superfamily II)/8-oxo-dGTP pyrophosphatase MutT (NUDIX family)
VTTGRLPARPRRLTEESAAPARPAATVVLLRPGPSSSPNGPEVLLTLRPESMAFGAGLHVFPGGRIEPADGQPEALARTRNGDAARVAALRELFEEAGVLVADLADGSPATSDRLIAAELVALRAQLVSGQLTLAQVLERFDLVLATDRLVEIARWQTPRVYPRRFDARFFAVEMPLEAVLDLDPDEVAGHAWLTPGAALGAMAAGEIELWPPTSTTLQRLERAVDMAAVRAGLELVEGLPFTRRDLGGGVIAVTGGQAFGPAILPANALLVGRQRVVVVDPGDQDEAFIDRIEAEVNALGGQIVAIVLTHVDPGHAAGSLELHERTGAPILAGPGGQAALPWTVTEIGDGATIDGDMPITVVGTPGHRPDHIALRLADSTVLSGDALTARPTLILPPAGDRDQAAESIRRIAGLRPSRIVPGHGALIDDPEAAARAALAALSS